MAKMGDRRRGRKSWDDMSVSQRQRVTQKRAESNFRRNYYKWRDGKRKKRPMFFKENQFINSFLLSINERIDKFDGNSDENRKEAADNKRENNRNYYETRARKVNRGNSYTKRGPQPSRIHREDQERIDNKPIDYQSLSDDEKLAAHEEYMIRGDVKKGWRCLLCKKFFDDEGEKNKLEYQGEVNGEQMTVYYHPECNK